MRQRNRADVQSIDRRELIGETLDQRLDAVVIEDLQHVAHALTVAENANAQVQQRPQPARPEMIAIEMCKADRANVADANPGAVHAFSGGARTDSSVDE